MYTSRRNPLKTCSLVSRSRGFNHCNLIDYRLYIMSISSTNANIKIFTFYGANNSRQLRKIISMLVVLSLIRKKNSGMRRIATNKQCLTTRVHAIY